MRPDEDLREFEGRFRDEQPEQYRDYKIIDHFGNGANPLLFKFA
jgi:hypothetical protein